jgi:hypothetical protein
MSRHEEGTATLKDFARILGERSPSYVTQLKEAGRLVLTADGKRVRVQESLALVRETADPARAGVAARHAAARQQGGGGVADAAQHGDSTSAGDEQESSPDEQVDPVQASHTRRRAKTLADQAELQLRRMEREEAVELGRLLPVETVAAAVRSATAMFRTALENLPNTIAPELAATSDEGRCRVLLSDALEHALEELSRQFATIAKRDMAA